MTIKKQIKNIAIALLIHLIWVIGYASAINFDVRQHYLYATGVVIGLAIIATESEMWKVRLGMLAAWIIVLIA